jgi:hypothetical protein
MHGDDDDDVEQAQLKCYENMCSMEIALAFIEYSIRVKL